MDINHGVADLHIHSSASDGTCSVKERITQARERDLEAIAITDHDTISDNLTGRNSSNGSLEIVTGVEVRADIQNTKVELLGYYVDPSNDQLDTILEQVRTYRRERNQKIIDRLHEVTALVRSYEEIRSDVPGLLGRPHIAEVLVKEGIVDSAGTAFETYLGSGGDAFVPMERVAATDVIDAIQGAGGVVSLAHPGRTRTDDIEGIVKELVSEGLDAIEVPYPYDVTASGDYADVTTEDAAAFADTFNLLQTGGSDCHGPNSGKFRIGEVRIARRHLNTLRTRASDRDTLSV